MVCQRLIQARRGGARGDDHDDDAGAGAAAAAAAAADDDDDDDDDRIESFYTLTLSDTDHDSSIIKTCRSHAELLEEMVCQRLIQARRGRLVVMVVVLVAMMRVRMLVRVVDDDDDDADDDDDDDDNDDDDDDVVTGIILKLLPTLPTTMHTYDTHRPRLVFVRTSSWSRRTHRRRDCRCRAGAARRARARAPRHLPW
jgi:hypothetical protein